MPTQCHAPDGNATCVQNVLVVGECADRVSPWTDVGFYYMQASSLLLVAAVM
jgi:hypothetical protein